jgi:hypothetical protein
LCPGGGGFFNFTKNVRVFWRLSIVSLNFSVVVTYVIFRSSRRRRFNFRTYFHSHFRWIRMHAHTARFRSFVLNCVQCSGGCVVCCLVHMSRLSRSYNEEKKMQIHGRSKKQAFVLLHFKP